MPTINNTSTPVQKAFIQEVRARGKDYIPDDFLADASLLLPSFAIFAANMAFFKELISRNPAAIAICQDVHTLTMAARVALHQEVKAESTEALQSLVNFYDKSYEKIIERKKITLNNYLTASGRERQTWLPPQAGTANTPVDHMDITTSLGKRKTETRDFAISLNDLSVKRQLPTTPV